jgi:NTE family protein
MFFKRAPKKIGLVLSGGGLRAIGHLGVMKALEQHQIKPSILSGTSAGAIVAAFYAAGHSPDEMLSIILKKDFFPRSYFRLRTSGLFDPSFLVKIFNEYIPDDFAKLQLPLYVAATELSAGLTEYFHEGSLYKALLATSSIPLIFPAVADQQKLYVDGGILNNLPIEPVKDKCDFLIGVHVNSISKGLEAPLGVRKTFDRIFHLALSNAVYAKSEHCHLFIDPPAMTQFGMLDKKNAHKIFEYAYAHTMEQLETVSIRSF